MAEAPDGATAKTLADIARKARVHLAVGMFTMQGNAVCNSQLLLSPEGKCLAVYNKAHLFSTEREVCRPGDKAVVVETPMGRIGMTICYDLIFPDYVRRLIELGADFIINSTNWINDPYQRDIWGWQGERTSGWSRPARWRTSTFLALAYRIGPRERGAGPRLRQLRPLLHRWALRQDRGQR